MCYQDHSKLYFQIFLNADLPISYSLQSIMISGPRCQSFLKLCLWFSNNMDSSIISIPFITFFESVLQQLLNPFDNGFGNNLSTIIHIPYRLYFVDIIQNGAFGFPPIRISRYLSFQVYNLYQVRRYQNLPVKRFLYSF